MIWLSFLVEWIIFPFFGLLFLAQKGKVTRAFSVLFFIMATPLVFFPQYFLLFNESAGTITEITFKPYTTLMIQFLVSLHFALVALSLEFLMDDLDRHGFENVKHFGKPRPA